MRHNLGPGRCDWRTPLWLLEKVREVFGPPIHLDPATAPDNPTGAEVFYTEQGLEQDWSFARNIFMNPPWSKELRMPVEWWVARMWDVAQDHPDKPMIATIPASVNSKWFHKYCWSAGGICFPEGRVAYDPPPGEPKASSPTFDTAIVYWGTRRQRFNEAFRSLGEIHD